MVHKRALADRPGSAASVIYSVEMKIPITIAVNGEVPAPLSNFWYTLLALIECNIRTLPRVAWLTNDTFYLLGVTFTDGPMWKMHRRFTLMTLRNFGMGKLSMQTRILKEASYFTSYLERNAGNKPDSQKPIQLVSSGLC